MNKKIILTIITLIIMCMSIASAEQCNETWTPCGGGCTATDMTDMFDGVTNFDTTIGNITGWNTSCVTNMSYMFWGATDFNQPIGSWDTGKVVYMNSMFLGASAFNQPLGSWNISNVVRTSEMFESTSFNQDISGWDMSHVFDPSGMFWGSPFNQDIGGWNMSSAIYFGSMFRVDSAFNQDISGWDVGSVVDMNYMFEGATTFNQNLGVWDITNVGDMTAMFSGVWLSTVNYDAILNGWATQSVLSGVPFDVGSSKYTSIGLSGRNVLTGTYGWTISDNGETCSELSSPCGGGCNITDMSYMFNGVTSFDTTIGNIIGWNTSCVTNMSYMFWGATDFNQDISSWDTSSVTDIDHMFTSAYAFNQNLSSWNTSSVTTMQGIFLDDNFNGNISGWDTSKVTDMSLMFNFNPIFNQPIGSWDVSSVTDMNYMFYKDYAFNQDISGWNTSSVIDMSYMFAGNDNDYPSIMIFNQDISSWDTSKVTTMTAMFPNSYFNQPIGSWDVSSVTDMSYMFYNGYDFDQNLSGWNISQLANLDYWIHSTTALVPHYLSTTNYDALLNSWASQSVQSSVYFDAGNSQYSIAGASARNDTLIGVYSWVITDGGLYVCTPNWTCDTYSACNSSNIMPCNSMADLNFCGTNFTGNISDYDTNCTYNQFNGTSQDFIGATFDTGVKLIKGFGAIAILFGITIAGVGIAFAFRKLIIKK